MTANTISLPTDYQSFIHQSRYSRFLDDFGRRETWEETVDRYMSNVVTPVLEKSMPFYEARELSYEIRDSILNLEEVIVRSDKLWPGRLKCSPVALSMV